MWQEFVISTNDKIISSRYDDGLFPIFVIEGSALFQLEINKNNLMCNFYPPIKIYGSSEFYSTNSDEKNLCPTNPQGQKVDERQPEAGGK